MSRRRRSRKRPYVEEGASSTGNDKQRGSVAGWLLMGVVAGLALALYYAWVVDPVVYTNANPSRLSDAYQREYIFLVSQSFAEDGNWVQAEQRLAQLRDPNLLQTVSDLLDAEVKAQSNPDLIRNLATMARQLGVQGQAVAIFAPTVPPNDLLPTPTVALVLQESETAVIESETEIITPTATIPPTETPIPTTVPIATRSATATPQPDYRLLDQIALCGDEDVTRIEVVTVDAFLNDMSGIEVLVTTQDSVDHFFTGFKPDFGIGYGDYEMVPDVSYSVVLADGSPEISGLRVETCDSGLAGGWRLTFQNLIFGATPTPNPDDS